MEKFMTRYRDQVASVVTGFDRLVLRGSLLEFRRAWGLDRFLASAGIRQLNFPAYARATSERIKAAAEEEARKAQRPSTYLTSSSTDKEELARGLLAARPVDAGLVCLMTVVEPCRSFEYHRSSDFKARGFRLRNRKCLHLYKYFIHPEFGFMNARLQTWFPFNIQLCLNGREWLARQLTRAGCSDFERHDNCFVHLGDPALAQRLLDEQLRTAWPQALHALVRSLNPFHDEIFRSWPMEYYWTAYQTEWATDLLFKSPAALANLYPTLVRHAMHHFHSPDVMRFLGRKLHPSFKGEVIGSYQRRPEGVRVKHYLNGNSIKMYDKAGRILRVETTLGDVKDFKVYRPRQGAPDGALDWLPMRKGIADLHRRAELSERANRTYLDALAAVDDTTPCSSLFDAVARPVLYNGRRARRLRLTDPVEVAVLEAVSRGEFATAGFRNRDLRRLLHPNLVSETETRALSGRLSRYLWLLRAHGVLRKIQRTHRYELTARGRLLTAALFASRRASIRELLKIAA